MMDVSCTDHRLAVAIVGAGMAGLVCARSLAIEGHLVRVFDKARGVGGRMSTRRAGSSRFDHGAQYFTVRDQRFARWVETWRREEIVAQWQVEVAVLGRAGGQTSAPRIERFVGVPGMNALCRHLAHDLDVALERRIGKLERSGDHWRLLSEDGTDLGVHDFAVVSAPAPQTAELLEIAAPVMARRAAEVEMAPCWAAMASFTSPLDVGFEAAFVHDSPLSWVARNASKPARPDGEAWVLHASPEWSHEHLEIDRRDAARHLLDAFRDAVGNLSSTPSHLDAHRWRYALPVDPLPELCLFDAELGLAACGDWCGGARVEGAFVSGQTVADRILGLG